MQRVTVGTSIIKVLSEDSGVLVAASVVTVTAVAHDGTTVTVGPVTVNTPVGVHSASMTVSRPTLVTLTWTVDGAVLVDTVDVVSRAYLTPLELRNTDPVGLPVAKYDSDRLAAGIGWASEECEQITGRCWVRCYRIVRASLDRFGFVRVGPDVVRVGALLVDGVVQDPGTLVPRWGSDSVWVPWCGQVEFGVELGAVEPTVQIKDAVAVRARQAVQRPAVSLYSERVVIGEGQTIVRSLPGGMKTGVAEVDAVYQRHAFAGGGGFA
jgi:hypothetical protein